MKSKWEKINRMAGEYSDKDYAAADRAAMLMKRLYGDLLRRKNLGDKNLHTNESEVENVTNRTRASYLKGLTDPKEKERLEKNQKFHREVDLPTANSIEQYNHEREAGDPNALNLSFKDWKKL